MLYIAGTTCDRVGVNNWLININYLYPCGPSEECSIKLKFTEPMSVIEK